MHLTALFGGETVCLLAVADGQGGPEAAQLCEDTLLQTIVKEAGAADAASLQAACSRAFATVHAAVCERESADAGACVTVVAINEGRGEVTCAHVGDSSALLVEESGHRPLTAEHRLSNSPEEQARVVASGARLAKARSDDGYFGVGPIRAWPGGLAVCRTVGDADCAYVDPTPSVCTLAFERPGGAKVIACSDGVWDALSEERVAKHVRAAATPADAAAKVVRAALRARGLRDDTTSVVAWAGEPSWGSRRRSPKPRRGSSRHLASLLSSSLASSPCAALGMEGAPPSVEAGNHVNRRAAPPPPPPPRRRPRRRACPTPTRPPEPRRGIRRPVTSDSRSRRHASRVHRSQMHCTAPYPHPDLWVLALAKPETKADPVLHPVPPPRPPTAPNRRLRLRPTSGRSTIRLPTAPLTCRPPPPPPPWTASPSSPSTRVADQMPPPATQARPRPRSAAGAAFGAAAAGREWGGQASAPHRHVEVCTCLSPGSPRRARRREPAGGGRG